MYPPTSGAILKWSTESLSYVEWKKAFAIVSEGGDPLQPLSYPPSSFSAKKWNKSS